MFVLSLGDAAMVHRKGQIILSKSVCFGCRRSKYTFNAMLVWEGRDPDRTYVRNVNNNVSMWHSFRL